MRPGDIQLKSVRREFCVLLLLLLTIGCAAAQTPLPTPQELRSETAPPHAIWLDSLDLSKMTQEYGTPHARVSVDNHPITLNGVVYPHGVGSHAISQYALMLNGDASRFVSMVGVDDEKKGAGSVQFQVWVDGKKVAQTPMLTGGAPAKFLSVDLTGARQMVLRISDAGDGIDSDHGDWAGAMIIMKPGAPPPVPIRVQPLQDSVAVDYPAPNIIFPVSARPEIHGPSVVGATPGRPFLFLIPATGVGPLRYSASGLPSGLSLNPNTGIISGTIAAEGVSQVELVVRGLRGHAIRHLTLVAGEHKLAQTPPLGWNSWNVWAGNVDDAKVRQAADWMVKSGLASHGFQYINIDDTWEGPRDANGEITTNKKFPDMKALADYVHSKGLKLGIYSSPGPTTCGGYPGSYQHEQQDAMTYARWGIDYLKYDWCSYGNVATGEGLERLQKPYATMRAALDNVPRDIVFSLCQYGMGDVWTWGTQVGGNLWRTTGDINDSWRSLNSIAFSQNGHEKYVSPGHWNDPDMLVVGWVGWGNPHPNRLTQNEQMLHISMWCLQSAPLLLGCDLSKLDPFTTALMSNDEVLAIDQDPMARPAARVWEDSTEQLQIWARPLSDGTHAVGLFNRNGQPAQVTVKWSTLGIAGNQPVRNLWVHKNLGRRRDSFTATVAPHGVVLVKIGAPGTASAK